MAVHILHSVIRLLVHQHKALGLMWHLALKPLIQGFIQGVTEKVKQGVCPFTSCLMPAT